MGDPRLNKLLEGCPELQEMLSEPEFMNQASEALRNPVHVRDILRSTDRSMTGLEALPNGAFDVFRQMCEDIRRPQEDEAFNASSAMLKSTKKGTAQEKTQKPKKEPREDGDEENPEGEEE